MTPQWKKLRMELDALGHYGTTLREAQTWRRDDMRNGSGPMGKHLEVMWENKKGGYVALRVQPLCAPRRSHKEAHCDAHPLRP